MKKKAIISSIITVLCIVAAVFLLVGNGMACRRLALRDEPAPRVRAELLQLSGDRASVREQTLRVALQRLRDATA